MKFKLFKKIIIVQAAYKPLDTSILRVVFFYYITRLNNTYVARYHNDEYGWIGQAWTRGLASGKDLIKHCKSEIEVKIWVNEQIERIHG